ncbi:YkuS family protein [Wukongibacter baidiensis]|uniref:YkuS family protein n=1 Tax=Wukongibacter baidiensis TaxID=1723361 RepID=UPI003D7FB43B
MKKNIVLNNVPSHIKEGLVERGYNVVDGSYEGYVDTILYNSDEGSLSYLNMFDNVIDMTNGAFIVDIKEKTPDEIVSMIENRSYTSLF